MGSVASERQELVAAEARQEPAIGEGIPLAGCGRCRAMEIQGCAELPQSSGKCDFAGRGGQRALKYFELDPVGRRHTAQWLSDQLLAPGNRGETLDEERVVPRLATRLVEVMPHSTRLLDDIHRPGWRLLALKQGSWYYRFGYSASEARCTAARSAWLVGDRRHLHRTCTPAPPHSRPAGEKIPSTQPSYLVWAAAVVLQFSKRRKRVV